MRRAEECEASFYSVENGYDGGSRNPVGWAYGKETGGAASATVVLLAVSLYTAKSCVKSNLILHVIYNRIF